MQSNNRQPADLRKFLFRRLNEDRNNFDFSAFAEEAEIDPQEARQVAESVFARFFASVIDDGEITNIKPGAGRMLGLFSVAELPRRLFLDFGELREGFEFKQIYGLFEIEDGNAWTKNLSIISSIAFVGITGRTGLAQQDFDQHISVVPNVTGSLPAISWILGGGQIGAVTLILDQLIGGEVNKSAATKYHVTGSWEKPVITKLPSAQAGMTPSSIFVVPS